MYLISSFVKGYFLRHWILFTILGLYALSLVCNAFGLATPLLGCIVSHFTGHECFGCGLNRAAIALLQWDFEKAYQTNFLIYIYTTLFISWITKDFYQHYQKSIYLNH